MQFICAAIILLACFTNRTLLLAAGVISIAYIFSSANWEQKFSFFMFLLSFSPVFKFAPDQTSLFMVLRLSVIISYIFQQKGKFSFTFVTIAIALFAYCIVISEIYKTEYLVDSINIILWILVCYVLVNTVDSSTSTPVLRGLVNGAIVTGIIGIFIKDIPQFEDFISDVVLLAEDGAEVSRYSGFWKDPNFFTVLLNASLWFTYLEFNKSRINIVEFVLRAGIVSFLGLVTMSKSCIILLVIFWLYLLVSKNNIKTTPKVCIIFVSIVLVGVFLYKNPYWFSDIMYRFTSGKDNVTIATVTTGRTEIWKKYFESLLDNMSWIFGQGVNSTAVKINGRAVGAHNTIIQSVYYFGAVGSFLYISLIYSVYNSNHNSTRNNYPHKISPVKFSFLSIMVSLLFLDGVLIEMFYYMLAMSFVYMNINSECNKSEDIDYLY